MPQIKKSHIPFGRALIFSFLSVIVIAGSTALLYTYYEYRLYLKEQSDLYDLKGIILNGKSHDHLTLKWISETLHLTKDAPLNLYKMDLEEVKTKLLTYPFIKSVSLSPLFPSILEINYEMRAPEFELGNRKSFAMDEEGIFFSLRPLYTEKRLPLLWLSEEAIVSPLDFTKLQLARSIRDHFLSHEVELTSIDLSRIDSPSLGYREVILTANGGGKEAIIRLPVSETLHALDRLFLLLAEEESLPSLIDLRFPNIALIE